MYRYAGSVKQTEEDYADLTIDDDSRHDSRQTGHSINSDKNDDDEIKEEVVR